MRKHLPDAELPWCHVLVDASKGAGQGSCIKFYDGWWRNCFWFFLDGEEAQQPVIFGALARSIKPTEPHGPKNNEI